MLLRMLRMRWVAGDMWERFGVRWLTVCTRSPLVLSQQFCETTVGAKTQDECDLWSAVFNTNRFKVSTVQDVAGVSLAGALKNVVALAAGFVDGLKLGSNTKASIMRMGLAEMAKFTVEFFPGSKKDT